MRTTELDPQACYRACSGRDARFDGRFVLAVVTTGIYCRPSCPARTPLPANCRFFDTADAAAAAGFRACRRCRPDAAPGSRAWNASGDLAARALRMIRDGVVDAVGVAGLAVALAISERQLLRVLIAEVGATPQQLNRSRRARTARALIEQSELGLAEVAFAAGFASVRQFNDAMRQEFGCTPAALRRRQVPAEQEAGEAALVLRLPYRAPLALAPLRRFLAEHVVAGLERHDPATGEHTRLVPAPHGPAVVTVALGADPQPAQPAFLTVRLRLADVTDLAAVVARLRRWLDLDADPGLVDAALASDPLLAPLVQARPGLRIPGAVRGDETALLAVFGQQVSLAAARTFAARLVAAFGEPGPEGLTSFPAPEALAAAGPEAIQAATGVTHARARTLHTVATAVAGGLVLDPAADRAATRARLLALAGIGPWTSEYVALRCLADPDAFPAGDLVLLRALGVRTARQAERRAEGWRPWRGYALLHLWLQHLTP